MRFDAVDDGPWHTMTTRDEHIWEEEVVEIFLDLDGSGVNYAELEISPANVVCDLRVERPAPSVKSLTEWDWTGMASTVVPLRDAHGKSEGWTALARLPWDGLGTLSPQAAARGCRRKPGDAWHFNVFRIKRPGGPKAPAEGAVLRRLVGPGRPELPRTGEVPAVQVCVKRKEGRLARGIEPKSPS